MNAFTGYADVSRLSIGVHRQRQRVDLLVLGLGGFRFLNVPRLKVCANPLLASSSGAGITTSRFDLPALAVKRQLPCQYVMLID
jgi:hypothetical protein